MKAQVYFLSLWGLHICCFLSLEYPSLTPLSWPTPSRFLLEATCLSLLSVPTLFLYHIHPHLTLNSLWCNQLLREPISPNVSVFPMVRNCPLVSVFTQHRTWQLLNEWIHKWALKGSQRSVKNPKVHLGKQPEEKLRILSNGVALSSSSGTLCWGQQRLSSEQRAEVLLAGNMSCLPSSGSSHLASSAFESGPVRFSGKKCLQGWDVGDVEVLVTNVCMCGGGLGVGTGRNLCQTILPGVPSQLCVYVHTCVGLWALCCLFLFLKTQFKWHLLWEALSSTLTKSMSPPLLSERL